MAVVAAGYRDEIFSPLDLGIGGCSSVSAKNSDRGKRRYAQASHGVPLLIVDEPINRAYF
jgi:hypothetical protein